MGRQTIPVPAESLRQIARGAEAAAKDQALEGNFNNAADLQNKADRAKEAAEGKSGEFASISGSDVSTLVAFGGHRSRAEDYKAGAVTFLKQYGVWS